MTMDNEKAIKILRKGYPDINRYAASELEAYEYDVETYNEAVSYAISHLEADMWVSVKDRMPEPRVAVMVYCPEYKNQYCAFYEDKHWQVFGAYDTVWHEVTHWKPLPQNPEESEGKF